MATPEQIREAAQLLRKMAGSKPGLTRAMRMTPEQRSYNARIAANARKK